MTKPTWVDETKIMAAERAWAQQCEGLRTSVKELIKDSKDTLQDFRSLPGNEKASYVCEMALLEKRIEWLGATVLESTQKLQDMISKQQNPRQDAEASEVMTTSEDLSAVGRAPPCASWLSLKTVGSLLALGSYRQCKSTADIKEKTDALKKEKGYVQDLMASTKTALGDLRTAKKRADAARKRAEEKATKKEEKKRKDIEEPKKRRKSIGAAKKHPVLSDDMIETGFPRLPHSSLDSALAFDFVLKPWVFRGDAADFMNVAAPGEEASEFARVFKTSALRVTEGQASRKVQPDLAKKFCTRVSDDLNNMWYPGPNESAQPAPADGTAKAMAATLCGIAAGHMSISKFEVALCPMVKYVWGGTALASVWVPSVLLGDAKGSQQQATTAEFQHMAMQADIKQVVSASKDEDIFVGTIGPGDFLYVPAGALFSVQARLGNESFLASSTS